MKKFKIALSLALAAATVLGSTGVYADSKQTLTVGVRDDIMNFGYLNTTTEKYYGLEIDLAYAIADDLGYKEVEFVTVQPDDRKDKLLNGEVDCLIAAYTIAESRLENFDFSPAYYTDYSRVIVERSSLLTSIPQLMGKRIGVVDGADAAPVFANKLVELGLIPEVDNETFDAVTFVRVDSYSELSKALEEGTVDAACMDGCVARAYMDDDRMLLEETLQEESYGVATQKDSKLSEPVAKAVQKMLDDGTLEDLIDKWD